MNIIRTSTLAAALVSLLLSGAALANGGINNEANATSLSGSASINGGNDQAITIEGSTTYGGDIPRQAPSIAAPALTTTLSETCMGSTSFGASGPGFGLTFGSTWRDEACVRRLDARELRSFGAGLPIEDGILFHLAAKERMCEDGKIRAAFERVAKLTGNKDALCQASADALEAKPEAAAASSYVEGENLKAAKDERAAWENPAWSTESER